MDAWILTATNSPLYDVVKIMRGSDMYKISRVVNTSDPCDEISDFSRLQRIILWSIFTQ
jgi:hypothetical protein